MQRSGGHLWGSSPLAQTWHDRTLFRAMYTHEVVKQDHIPVSSRQGRPPLSAALPDSGGISEHTSMGFFGVKKRHPYPSGQRSFGVKGIIDFFNYRGSSKSSQTRLGKGVGPKNRRSGHVICNSGDCSPQLKRCAKRAADISRK